MSLETNFSTAQILGFIRSLPNEQKLQLALELEKEIVGSKLSELLTAFKTDELSFEDITAEVEMVRQEIYNENASSKSHS